MYILGTFVNPEGKIAQGIMENFLFSSDLRVLFK